MVWMGCGALFFCGGGWMADGGWRTPGRRVPVGYDSAGGELILGWRKSALFLKSPLSERQQAASSDFLKTVLAEFRQPRSQPPDEAPATGSTRLTGVPFTVLPFPQKKEQAGTHRPVHKKLNPKNQKIRSTPYKSYKPSPDPISQNYSPSIYPGSPAQNP